MLFPFLTPNLQFFAVSVPIFFIYFVTFTFFAYTWTVRNKFYLVVCFCNRKRIGAFVESICF